MAEHVIHTTSGRVAGDTKRGIRRWKGIPFAAPPVGELRFAAPQPVESWSAVRDATGRFPICPQLLSGVEAATGGSGGAPQSEAHCLTLNVWSPATGDAGRPVMFWIHGGAFQTGAGSIPWYDGTNLAARGVVAVTCNYRLGPLGFLYLDQFGGEDVAGSGNAGLLDQIAALQWVRDNIAEFGGDPGNVTIFGESAGGMSVATLLGTPAARGLFHRAIPQSGAASAVRTSEFAASLTERVMAAVGVSDVAGLRTLPVERLVQAQTKIATNIGAGGLPFAPVLDGVVVPRSPLATIADGGAAGIDLLAGWNAEEMKLFSLLDPQLASLSTDRLARIVAHHAGSGVDHAAIVAAYAAAADDGQLVNTLLTDTVFRLPAIALLERQASHARTFGYEFRFKSTAFDGVLGAAHAVEIPFVFDNLDRPGVEFITGAATDATRALATAMADAWVAFAHHGVPAAGGLPDWPEYDPDHRLSMVLDLAPAVESDPGGDLRRLWPTDTWS